MSTTHPTSEELFAYRDGELSGEAARVLEAHVVSCTACRARIDAMSAAEGSLRQTGPEPDERYLDQMTEAVMAKVAGTPSASAAPTSGPERAGRRRNFEDDRRGRAPGLPWPAIISTVSAAAAVVVVAVMLFQRQNAWRHAPAPGVVGLPEKRAPVSRSKAKPDEAAARGAKKGPAANEAPGRDAPRGDLAGGVKQKEEAGKSVPAPSPAEDEESRDKVAAGAFLEEKALSKDSAASVERPSALREFDMGGRSASAPTALAPSSGFDRIVERAGLPPIYDPERVSDDAVLRAEPAIRLLYQSGRAGEDSARVRLYLAEAARLKAGAAPDSATYDAIVHHYRRAVRLARDGETARVARQRLQDFVTTISPAP